MTTIFSDSAARISDRSMSAIAVFCGLGLVVSFCLISSGVNLGAGWY